MERTNIIDTIRDMDRRGQLGHLDSLSGAETDSIPPNPNRNRRRGKTKPGFTFIDLFAGIGGMRYAFEAMGGACVATCEWDKFSRKTYAENFPIEGHPFFEDIRTVAPQDIPVHDVLVAGFPCQPFSIAGVSKKNALGTPHGFKCENQGNLFFNIRDILAHHRPQAFLLENVKNLVSHDRGNTFAVIRHTLEKELGYTINWQIIDGKGWVPQHRERTIIVGFRDGHRFDFDAVEIADRDKGPRLRSILHAEDGSEKPENPYTEGNKARVADKYTLTAHLWTYLQNYAAKHKAAGNGFGFGLVGPDDTSRTLSARYYKDGSEILIEQAHTDRPRRLTPRECARLMGFDNKQRTVRIPVSDTQAYRQFGNAVIVPVIEAVAQDLVKHLTTTETAAVANGFAGLSLAE